MNELQISNGLLMLILILALWSMVWKGIALWKAARNNHLAWFIIMMIINTVGILEIIYIFALGNKNCCKDKECCKDNNK